MIYFFDQVSKDVKMFKIKQWPLVAGLKFKLVETFFGVIPVKCP